ncbi:MAG: DinB family protein [Vicinamibacterales bacterium]
MHTTLAARLVLTIALLFSSVPSHPATAAEDPRITEEERTSLLDYLDRSQREFEALLQDVSDAQWNWTPAPERWSIAEVARHIVISEDYLFEQSMLAMRNPADPEWMAKTGGKTALLERALPDRTRKVQAPEPLNPLGGPAMTRAEVLAAFRQKRAKTREFAMTTQLPLREHLTKGLFPIFDPLNAYQFVLYIPLHNLRHNLQLAEVKRSPGYPPR